MDEDEDVSLECWSGGEAAEALLGGLGHPAQKHHRSLAALSHLQAIAEGLPLPTPQESGH